MLSSLIAVVVAVAVAVVVVVAAVSFVFAVASFHAVLMPSITMHPEAVVFCVVVAVVAAVAVAVAVVVVAVAVAAGCFPHQRLFLMLQVTGFRRNRGNQNGKNGQSQ